MIGLGAIGAAAFGLIAGLGAAGAVGFFAAGADLAFTFFDAAFLARLATLARLLDFFAGRALRRAALLLAADRFAFAFAFAIGRFLAFAFIFAFFFAFAFAFAFAFFFAMCSVLLAVVTALGARVAPKKSAVIYARGWSRRLGLRRLAA